MKVGIIGNGKTTLTEAIERIRNMDSEITIVEQDSLELTKNKPYEEGLNELLRGKLDSLKIKPLPVLPEIDSEQYKTGRESRRERRKQERNSKKL